MKKKLLSLLVAMAMVFAMVPSVFAQTDAAKIVRDGSPVSYSTLDAALADAKDGETILVTENCTTTAGINLNSKIKSLTIQGEEGVKPTITFGDYGIALWGQSLTFKNCDIVMNKVGSTPYTAEWGWMSICANPNSSINLDNASMTLDGDPEKTGTRFDKEAIFVSPNFKLNLNNSSLSILNYKKNALEWNGGTGNEINLKNSTFTADNNRSGIVGTFTVTADTSNINVTNSTGNGSNGSHFYLTDSTVNFTGNGSHGLSTGALSMVNSNVIANENGYYGVTCSGNVTIDGTSTLTANGNATSGRFGGVRLTNAAKTAEIASGAQVTINNNHRNGLENYRTTTFADGAVLTIMYNTEENRGGGIYNEGTLTLPEGAKVYNNHAKVAGDDIFSEGSITIGETVPNSKLDKTPDTNDCEQPIDGWYDDSADLEAENNRWNAHDLNAMHIVPVAAGTMENVALKAAHGILGVDESAYIPEIIFTKLDGTTKAPLAGVEFSLYGNAECTGEPIEVYTTDEYGKIYVNLAEIKDYYLKETKAPAGYRPLEAPIVIHLEEDAEAKSSEYVLNENFEPAEIYESITYYAKEPVVTYQETVLGLDMDTESHLVLNTQVRDVTFGKVWVDAKDTQYRTESVDVSLRANGEEIGVFELSEENEWKMTLSLPKFDAQGKEIKYSIEELTKVKNYKVSYSEDSLTVYNTLELPEPEVPEKPETPETPEKPDAPDTGDSSNMGLWISLLVVSAVVAAVAVIVFVKKRKAQN